MDPWFHFSQEDFTSFVKTTDTAERTALVKSSFQLHTRFCASKAKALCDLAYEILEYCMITELNFTALCYLMFSVWKELEHMMKSCSQDSRDMDFMARFKLSMNECMGSFGPLSPVQTTLIMKFYADRFLRNEKLYRYVLHQLPDEIEQEICLEISTPTFPLPLRDYTAPSDM